MNETKRNISGAYNITRVESKLKRRARVVAHVATDVAIAHVVPALVGVAFLAAKSLARR